jgi:hypothetical protein
MYDPTSGICFEFNAGRLFLDPINPAASIPVIGLLNNAVPTPSGGRR